MVVPYNPQFAILWGASHNVQRVRQHSFEQNLAEYISKPEPSCNMRTFTWPQGLKLTPIDHTSSNPLHTQNSFNGGEELHQLNTRKL